MTSGMLTRLSMLFAVSAMTTLAVLWIFAPTDDGPRVTAKGDFIGIPLGNGTFELHAGVQAPQDLPVSPKGDFLGWFPDTGNLELQFRLTETRTETPLRFPKPEFDRPVVRDIPRATTRLVALASAPFPYTGRMPRSNRPFLNVVDGKRRAHKTRSGRTYWADETYSDRRTLLHIPKGFDIKAPGVIVLFFHGHGATLQRDVFKRQRLPQQVTESGMNAVLVAPQFALDARDSSAGKFWEKGGVRRFLDEAAQQLAKEHGTPGAAKAFAKMPVVMVAYSGGFVPAASTVTRGGIGSRLKGVVLLDGLYGRLDQFANWMERDRSAFFINAYAGASPTRNSARLMAMLKERGIRYSTRLDPQLKRGSVTFLAAKKRHRHYVTNAWVRHPVSDVLRRLGRITGQTPQYLSKVITSQ